MTQFERELQSAGYTDGSMAFYHCVLEAFVQRHPEHSYEWLARRPKLGLKFCDGFREAVGLPRLEDHTIMGGLENGRKQRVRYDIPFSRN